jgi:6-phosphogluconolactonase
MPLVIAAETPDPSWVAIHPSEKFLYAVNEAGKSSMVSAFAVEAHSGKLTLLNQLPSLGEDPCYISFDKTGKYVFVANYTSGNVVVFSIGADGKLGAATANVKDQGTVGPNKERQEGPHAHWVQAALGNRMVYVADLGLDRILIYGFDPATGKLIAPRLPADVGPGVALAPGTGPRHAVLSGDGDLLYVLGELRSTLIYCLPHALRGFQPVQALSTLPPDFKSRNDAAEIEIHSSGKFLYVSNRGNDSIAVFALNRGFHLEPERIGIVSSGGKEPRHFAIDPSGNFLLAENQFSNNIVSFRIDQKTGALTPTGDSVDVPSPVCLVFLAVE